MMGVQIPPGLPSFLPGENGKKGEDTMPFSIREKYEAAIQFLREVKTELKKVTWPSRRDTVAGTAVVLVAVFIIAIFLGIVDSGLSTLIRELLKKAAS
jgi:preprotein translocase SecE subunit